MSKIDSLAKIVWNYHLMHQQLQKCDAVFTLCSLDPRVAERAAQLYLEGFGGLLIFSGGFSEITRSMFEGSEADHFAAIARRMGVPEDRIIIENKSTNTGENVRFTYDLLKSKSLHLHSFILVQKPYMERRTYATFKKQWPDLDTQITVTSPQIPYEKYFNDENPKDLTINLMVGYLQRIKEYPKKGFQIEQNIPARVWEANQQLIALGYDKELIR